MVGWIFLMLWMCADRSGCIRLWVSASFGESCMMKRRRVR